MAYQIELTSWSVAADHLRPLRTAVFVVEQGVPAELEMDERDGACVHALVRDSQGLVIGTGRLLPADSGIARIGRMAVTPSWRGKGVGKAVLAALMQAAKARGDRVVELHAQLHAAPFYDKQSFERIGDVYAEAGIAHVTMRSTL